MLAVSELARLRRDIEAVSHVLDINLRPGAKSHVTDQDRRTAKAEIERCIQARDEMRGRLSNMP